MPDFDVKDKRLGWVGTGRMGYALATRLLAADADLAVYNRTRAKAEPLAELGATVVDEIADLAGREIVFTSVSDSAAFAEAAGALLKSSPPFRRLTHALRLP